MVEVEVEIKKSSGVVEEQFLENMKNYNNLKDALTSLSSDIDKVKVRVMDELVTFYLFFRLPVIGVKR